MVHISGRDHCSLVIDELMALIGTEVAKMHQADIIHGDLTTSNMMLRRSGATHPTVDIVRLLAMYWIRIRMRSNAPLTGPDRLRTRVHLHACRGQGCGPVRA